MILSVSIVLRITSHLSFGLSLPTNFSIIYHGEFIKKTFHINIAIRVRSVHDAFAYVISVSALTCTDLNSTVL